MGRATRWLKSLFVSKTEDDNDNNNNKETPNAAGMCHNPFTIPPNLSPMETAWLRSYYLQTEKEQSKHAIAVAAATAAAADAAIVAAHAAATVVKLTDKNRGMAAVESASAAVLKSCTERNAAVRIQSVFRGYLGRKALRALRSLVKIQAVVRGFLVRKQAAAMLMGMQALVRAQASVLSRRVRLRDSRCSGEFVPSFALDKLETRSRRYSSAFESTADKRAKDVEMDTSERPRPRSRSRRNSLSIYESVTKDQIHYYTSTSRLSPFAHHSDCGLNGDECKFSTAHSTPKFTTKRSSELWTLNSPSYMANTQSFRAKLRSNSAPKQRSLDGEEGRNSISMTSSMSFKNAVTRKINGSSDEWDERRNGNYIKNGVRR